MRSALIAIAAALALPLPALAGPESESYVGSFIATMQQEARGDEADYIIDAVDLPSVVRFVLGKHGRTASPEEIELFSYRFDAFLRDVLRPHSAELSTARVEILSSSDRNEADSIVTTRVSTTSREPALMRWRLLNRDGEWKLVDVQVHGLWLAIEQRAQISARLDQRGASIATLYDGAITEAGLTD